MKKLNQSGFSLVELMVVVAIIGVLATVAIPRVNKFIAKARTSEAQVNLGSIYTFNKNFYVEFQGYTNDFGAMGFIPEGNMRYNVGWGTVGVLVPGNYASLGKTGNTGIVSSNGICVTSTAAMTAANPCVKLMGADGALPPDVVPGAAIAADFATFTAGAVAVLRKDAGTDSWTINEVKQLKNSSDGT